MAGTLYASFADYDHAEKAVGALLDYGVRDEDISLVSGESHGRTWAETYSDHEMNDSGHIRIHRRDRDHDGNPVSDAKGGISTTTGADAASGAAKGAGIGLGVGVLAALGALFVPGAGLVAGPAAIAWATGLAAGTTAAGAVAGGVTGYLKDQGVPEHAAMEYHRTLEQGGVLIGIRTPSGDVSEETVRGVLDKYGASNVGVYGTEATGGYMHRAA
ncbi:MAG: hypothetical protein ACK47B_23445 [Armatimonadota bacterium]